MSRRRIRQLVAIILLALLLAAIALAYWNYSTTRDIGIGIDFDEGELLAAPKYLYSFNGEGDDRLARPLGVLAEGGRVYVTDSRRGVIDVFTPQGGRVAKWGEGKLVTPLYLARHPKSGDIYVTDRRKRALEIFSEDGTYKGSFDPKLPKDELPDFDTKGYQWAPVALAFAPDGSMVVSEILNGHRILFFGPDGSFKKSVGTAGLVNRAEEGEGVFQFPNSVKIYKQEVWVSDSNNRRVQVFDLDGEYDRMVVTQGLPRGFDFLPKLENQEPDRFVVIDTLAHDATIWDAEKGSKILTFGARGVLEGQFNYPNDTSVDARRRIFVADTANGRIQVWGWPAAANPVPLPSTPLGWLACLSPLLLLPLLLLLRRRRHFVTADFVYALYELEAIDRMPNRRVRWEMLPAEHAELAGMEQGGIVLSDLLHPVEHSDSDAKALQERYELSWRDAVALSLAQRAKLFGTEDPELRRLARVLEVPVIDHLEYIARTAGDSQSPSSDAE